MLPHTQINQTEWQMRVDLAAALRLAAHYDWHEAVANHFSLAVSPDGTSFLMNPRWQHFSRMKATDLLLLDANDKSTMPRPDAPDLTAWSLHGRLHAALPHARCIIHLHPPYATASHLLLIQKSSRSTRTRLDSSIASPVDTNYGGMANTDAEGDRLARLMGNRSIMMMGNHGVLVCAATVAEAFDLTYYLERACRNLVLAYQSGQKLHVMSLPSPRKPPRNGNRP